MLNEFWWWPSVCAWMCVCRCGCSCSCSCDWLIVCSNCHFVEFKSELVVEESGWRRGGRLPVENSLALNFLSLWIFLFYFFFLEREREGEREGENFFFFSPFLSFFIPPLILSTIYNQQSIIVFLTFLFIWLILLFFRHCFQFVVSIFVYCW